MIELRPMTLRQAKDFVWRYHRHSDAPVGGRFAIAALASGELVGVIIVGRPVARGLDDGATAEATRVCVRDGAPKGTPSRLLRAAWRAWSAMGGRRLVTYTLTSESGSSLRGAGFANTGSVAARTWSCGSRPRRARDIEGKDKLRWELRA